jgi:hypothetical protein
MMGDADRPRLALPTPMVGVIAGPPCSSARIADGERSLGAALPDELVALYRAADGLFDEPGQWYIVWPLDRVVVTNVQLWNDGLLDQGLVAFGDDGTGAPFCLRRHDPARRHVLRWSLIDGAVETDEGVLNTFLRTWAHGPA